MPFNSNPRALNYYKKTSMDGAKDIFAFSNFGDPKTGLAAVEYYTRQVKSIMYNDIFLTFENITKQMQNPEVQERINEKMAMLGPAVGRYMGAVLNPVVTRTIGILQRAGRLPEIPEALRISPSFEIDYVSQLAQAQKRSELASLLSGLELIGGIAQGDPSVMDKINTDTVVDEAWDILGAPVKVLRADSEVQKIRENKAQMAAQQEKLLQAQAMAKAGKDMGAAEKSYAEAQDPTRGKK
jgi:hypothetical protein